MTKKTCECQGCGIRFSVEEDEKEPRCRVCSSFAVVEASDEKPRIVLDPLESVSE